MLELLRIVQTTITGCLLTIEAVVLFLLNPFLQGDVSLFRHRAQQGLWAMSPPSLGYVLLDEVRLFMFFLDLGDTSF